MSDVDDSADEIDGNRAVGGRPAALLEYLAHAIVDEPEAVFIDVEEGRQGVTLRLHVAPDDVGKVIGKRGRVAQALRTLVRAAGVQDSVSVNVDIVD